MPERSFILDIPLPCQVDAELPLTQVIVLTRPSDSYVGFLFLLPLLYPLPSFVYPDSVLPLPLAPVSCPSFPGDVSSPSGISDVSDPRIPSSSRQTFMTGHAIWGFCREFSFGGEKTGKSPQIPFISTPCRRVRFRVCYQATSLRIRCAVVLVCIVGFRRPSVRPSLGLRYRFEYLNGCTTLKRAKVR